MATFGEFYKGESRSKYDQSGFDSTTNLDVHTEVGSAKAQLGLVEDSATPNEACISAVLPNGDVFFASTASGKIWKRKQSDGAYSLVHTNGQGAHTGIRNFDGNLYYWTISKLGKITTALASSQASWSSENDSFGTFTNSNAKGDAVERNLSLFIPDGNFIASVDNAGTFAANALDLPSGYRATSLAGVGTDILIGTIIGTKSASCKVFLWDTYSPTWVIEDTVPEIGVNAFIDADNELYAQCGTSGEIYQWTGKTMIKVKKARGQTTSQTSGKSTVLNGKALIAMGTDIYSLYRDDKDLPVALVHEYTASASISSILGAGDELYVSIGTAIHKLDTDRGIAVLTTPEVQENFQNVTVRYDSFPSGANITIETSINDEGTWTNQTELVDNIFKTVSFEGGLGAVQYGQARITLTPNGANTPVIKSIQLT